MALPISSILCASTVLWAGITLAGCDCDDCTRVGPIVGYIRTLVQDEGGSPVAGASVHLDNRSFHLAQKAAASAFPDLPDYLLYSVTPRVLQGDSRGLHWQVRWQERAFPHHRWVVVRVYMKDGHTTTEREVYTEPSPTSAPAH